MDRIDSARRARRLIRQANNLAERLNDAIDRAPSTDLARLGKIQHHARARFWRRIHTEQTVYAGLDELQAYDLWCAANGI